MNDTSHVTTVVSGDALLAKGCSHKVQVWSYCGAAMSASNMGNHVLTHCIVKLQQCCQDAIMAAKRLYKRFPVALIVGAMTVLCQNNDSTQAR